METEQINSTPEPNIDELETSISELVEVIKEQEQVKEEEKILENEQILLDQKAKEKEEQILAEEDLAKEKADAEFKEQLLQSLQVEAPQQIDYTAQLDTIIVSLDNIHQKQAESDDANYIIGVYGFIVIPGAFLIWTMWKMIKPFLP